MPIFNAASLSDRDSNVQHQMKLGHEAITPSQVLSGLWDELGTEIILLSLFCSGYLLFRMTSVRRLFPRLLLGGADAQGAKLPVSPPGSRKGRSMTRRDGPSATDRSRATEAPRHASSSGPARPNKLRESAAARAHEARVQAALQELDSEGAWAALTAMCRDGCEASGFTVAAVVVLARGSSGSKMEDSGLLGRLPFGAMSPDAVAALLDHAGKEKDVDFLREICKHAGQEHVPLSPPTCERLLRAFASAGDSRAVEVFEEVTRGGYTPCESALTAIVSLCSESRDVELAERLVAHSRRVHGRVILALYSALMKVYSHAKLWHKTCDLYEAMRSEGMKPDTVAYGSLIKAAVESSRPELARRLFQESGNPDLLNYMSLIRAAGRERDVAKALRLLDELEASPLSADVTAYNCALEACAACGDRKSADILLQRMHKGGHVDVVSYNTYLKVLLSEGASDEVSNILAEMRSRGLQPNAVTYNSMVRDAVSRGDLVRGWGLVEDMERTGVNPDAFTCSILMKGVKHAPCAEDVDRIIALIKRASVTPDEVLVNCLLDACVRLRDTQRLTHILEQFRATGVVPSPHAYTMLIRAYGHARRLDRAWELWHELTGGRASPVGEDAFAGMVEACLASSDLNGAASVFREVRERLPEFQRAPSVFAAVAKACIQCKQAGRAVDLYSDTKDLFVCGRVTYNTLIDALVRAGDMSRAGELFRDMTLKNVTPDLISYSTLIKGHCARGDLEQGLQLLGLMQRRGIAPDAVLFNSILDGCAHKQMRTLTEQVLGDMEVAGIAPSNFTLSILTKLYGRCGDLDAAFDVVESYPGKYGFKVNAQVYTCLMSACIANGELSRALDVYETMSGSGCAADAKTYQTLLSGCLRHGDLDGATRLVRDAVGCGGAARLDHEAAEAVLLLAVRRGRVQDVAAPLLEELQAAGLSISDRVSGAVRGGEGPPRARVRRGPGLRQAGAEGLMSTLASTERY